MASDAGLMSAMPSALVGLLDHLVAGPVVDEAYSSLIDEAVAVTSRPGFETLLCRDLLAFEPFDYQVRSAQTVLRRMRGRAILADEVGLGKTIEAGLVLSELRMRGLADRALARALRTRYLLLLTATPVENRLQDLYELVSLVAPGLLGTTPCWLLAIGRGPQRTSTRRWIWRTRRTTSRSGPT